MAEVRERESQWGRERGELHELLRRAEEEREAVRRSGDVSLQAAEAHKNEVRAMKNNKYETARRRRGRQ